MIHSDEFAKVKVVMGKAHCNGYPLVRVRNWDKVPVSPSWQNGEANELLFEVTPGTRISVQSNDQRSKRSKYASNPTPTPSIASSSDLDFGIIGYCGDAWSIQYRGKQTKLLRPDGWVFATSVDVVIVKASDRLCRDGLKNLAVVPLDNLRNEQHGGPLLLRVAVSSLKGMAQFAEEMKALGYPYYSFGVRISIDKGDGHPRFLFSATRVLTDEEADVVIGLQTSRLVPHILTDGSLSSTSTAATLPIESRELKGRIYSEADALLLLNSNFFLADQGSAFPVARATESRIVYVGDKDFKNKLANIRVRVSDRNGEVKSAELWWRQHEGRAERRIIFDPKRPPGFSIDGTYNIWSGFDVLPEKGWQNQRRLLRHIREVICAGDKIAFNYLMRWLAWSIQHPDRKAETMIVLKSAKQGTGKTTLNNVMSRIFGRNSILAPSMTSDACSASLRRSWSRSSSSMPMRWSSPATMTAIAP